MTSVDDNDDTPNSNFRFLDIAEEPQRILQPIEGYENMPLVSLEQAVEPLHHLLSNIQAKVLIAKQRCKTPSDGLSSDQSASICLYSMQWSPYDKSLYFVLNATLRDENRQNLKPWFSYLKLLFSALACLPPIPTTVYRGVKVDLVKAYPKGETVVWWSFSSCTSFINVLESEQFLGKTGTRTMFNIKCHTGRDIRQHSYFQKENEVLLLAGTRFQVVACLDQGNGLHMVQLEELDPSFSHIQPVAVPNSSLWRHNLLLCLVPFLIALMAVALPVALLYSPVIKLFTSVRSPHLDTYRNPKLEVKIAGCLANSRIGLTGQNLTDQDMHIVIKEAIINKQCSELWLHDNRIGPKGASLLASALHKNTKLKELYLSNNSVSDKGVQSLVQTLSTSGLKKLDLGNDGITDNGTQHLADMLKTKTSLTDLYIHENKISDKGVQMLANALAYHNTILKSLDLHDNELVSDSSVDSLVDMIQHNRSLKKLDVQNCNLSENGKSRLHKAASENPALKVHT